jgi:hypothetical protein
MARITYDQQTATAFKAVRDLPRDGLSDWREAVRPHLHPSRGMTLVGVGAGTGVWAAVFGDWFDLDVVAVEPSSAMRAQISPTPACRVLERDAMALPLPEPIRSHEASSKVRSGRAARRRRARTACRAGRR